MMISFIVVHYKTYEYTKQAVQSILDTVHLSEFEIIIFDNDSNDGSVKKLKDDFESYISDQRIVLVESVINGGFSYGNNRAYEIAIGDYIILLNSDAKLVGDVALKSVQYLKRNPEVGVVTAKLINQFGVLDQGCKRGFPNPKNAVIYYLRLGRIFPKLRALNTYKLNHLDENTFHNVDAVSGAFMVIPKSVIEKTGFFDEDFFMYGEDLDLCYRIKEKGFEVHYNPALGDVLHYKGQSGKRLKLKTTYEFYRAMAVFYDKHYYDKYSFWVNVATKCGIALLFIFKITIGQVILIFKR